VQFALCVENQNDLLIHKATTCRLHRVEVLSSPFNLYLRRASVLYFVSRVKSTVQRG